MMQEYINIAIAAAAIIGATWLIIVIFRRARRRASVVAKTPHSAPVTSMAARDHVVAIDGDGNPIKMREKELIDRIAADPRDVQAYELLGHVYMTQGNQQDAVDCFRQVLALMPDNLRAVEQLRRITRGEGNGPQV